MFTRIAIFALCAFVWGCQAGPRPIAPPKPGGLTGPSTAICEDLSNEWFDRVWVYGARLRAEHPDHPQIRVREAGKYVRDRYGRGTNCGPILFEFLAVLYAAEVPAEPVYGQVDGVGRHAWARVYIEGEPADFDPTVNAWVYGERWEDLRAP